MRILITGAQGQLGRTLKKTNPQIIVNKQISLIFKSKNELDLSDEYSCRDVIKTYKPAWIINCGAYTSVDKAESEKKIAFNVNGRGPYFLAKYLKEIGGKLIQISTDFVFDGESNKAYKTNHPLKPLNVYGESKAMAENLLTCKESEFDNIFILRTSWVVGNIGNNFYLTILKLISKKKEIRVINDQIGCITSLDNLAKVCWELIAMKENSLNLPNILHFSDSGICTWYDVARAIFELASEKNLIRNYPNIIPVSSEYFNLPAKRPNFSLLDSQETYKLLGFNPTHWRKSLDILLDSKITNISENSKIK